MMRLPLLIGVVGLVVVVVALSTGGFGLGASMNTADVSIVAGLSIVAVALLLAFYLSGKRSQNVSHSSLKREQEMDQPASQLKHASASASTRQSVEEESAWS